MRTVVLVLVACASFAFGDTPTPPVLGQPLLLRLEGELLQTPAEARAKSGDFATLGFLDGEGGTRILGIEKARTIGGDHALLGKDVLDLLKPFDPNLLLTGPPDLVDKVRGAPPGTKILLEGLLHRAQRIYYLRDVKIG